MGDLSKRRDIIIGPFSVFLSSTEVDPETGKAKYVEEINQFTGKRENVLVKEKEPFLKDVWYRKNTLTANSQKKIKEWANEPDATALGVAIKQIVMMVAKWDLTNNKIPVPLTEEAILEADVDHEILDTILNRYYEVTRPPLVQNETLP